MNERDVHAYNSKIDQMCERGSLNRGEPAVSRLGEPPAPRRDPSDGRRLSERLVDDAVERARLRSMVKRPDGERISDEVIDELLAGARPRRRSLGPGAVGAVDQAAGGAGDGGRADRPSRL